MGPKYGYWILASHELCHFGDSWHAAVCTALRSVPGHLRLNVRRPRSGGQGCGAGVPARRAPPAAALLPVRIQVWMRECHLLRSRLAGLLLHGSYTCMVFLLRPLLRQPRLRCIGSGTCSGPGQVMELELGTDTASMRRLLNFLTMSFSGGTDVGEPLWSICGHHIAGG